MHQHSYFHLYKILICRWQANKEVTVITNYDEIHPFHEVKRWQNKKVKKDGSVEEGKYVKYQQLALLHNYKYTIQKMVLAIMVIVCAFSSC